jgi:predicted enzyme related to lactoylglutathione lyase
MTTGIRTVIYPVDDLAAARDLFTAVLGVEPHTDQPYYVGFRVDDQEVGLDPNGRAKGMTGPVGYWHVPDVKAALAAAVAHRAEVQSDVTDVGGGKLIATVTDPAGNPLGLLQET